MDKPHHSLAELIALALAIRCTHNGARGSLCAWCAADMRLILYQLRAQLPAEGAEP